MAAEFDAIFGRLRLILEKHAGDLNVAENSASRYSLDAPVGPAAIKAWGGKVRAERMPVAWAQIGKAYVSFHMMALSGNPQLAASMSKLLHARMQGKTCFNFTKVDDTLFVELEDVTARGIAGFRKAGYIV